MDAAPDPHRAELAALPTGTVCARCGYDLRLSTSLRCPECGDDLGYLRTSVSHIPWVRRREIGRMRAYWRTMSALLLRPRYFCAEAIRPVSYADAQRFRWATVIATYVALLAARLAHALRVEPPYDFLLSDVRLAVPLEIGTFLSLVAVTGAASYLFHPRRLPLAVQNRAVALSYYACAPLAWTPLVMLVLTAPLLIELAISIKTGERPNSPPYVAPVVGTVLACGVGFTWYNLVLIARHVLRSRRDVWRVALLTPVLWAAISGVLLFGVPAAAAYLATMADSLL